MNYLAIIVASVMGLISLLHFYWAFAGKIGLNSAGPNLEGKEKFMPGRLLTFLVAIVLASIAILAIQLLWPFQIIANVVSYAGYFVSFVLIARAIGDFRYLGFFKKVYNSNFSTLDTRFFSPLCLLLGLAYGVLATNA